MANIILFYGQFTAAKAGKTGLTVGFEYDRIKRSDGTVTTVTGLSAVEDRRGVYRYSLATADLQTYDYLGVFVTADTTVDLKEVPALWVRYSEAVATDAAGGVALATAQSAYAPAKAGDAMALTGGERTALAGVVMSDVSDVLGADIVAIKAKTDSLPASYPTVVAGKVAATVAAGDSADLTTLLASFNNSQITGTVVDTTPTAASFKGSSGLSSLNDWYGTIAAGTVLTFTSGVLKGLSREVTGYVGFTRQFTFAEPFPAAPANGDSFALRGWIVRTIA